MHVQERSPYLTADECFLVDIPARQRDFGSQVVEGSSQHSRGRLLRDDGSLLILSL